MDNQRGEQLFQQADSRRLYACFDPRDVCVDGREINPTGEPLEPPATWLRWRWQAHGMQTPLGPNEQDFEVGSKYQHRNQGEQQGNSDRSGRYAKRKDLSRQNHIYTTMMYIHVCRDSKNQGSQHVSCSLGQWDREGGEENGLGYNSPEHDLPGKTVVTGNSSNNCNSPDTHDVQVQLYTRCTSSSRTKNLHRFQRRKLRRGSGTNHGNLLGSPVGRRIQKLQNPWRRQRLRAGTKRRTGGFGNKDGLWKQDCGA